MTDASPTINIHLDTRMGMLDVGIPQLEALIENWPDATPEATLEVVTRINLTAVRLLDALQDLTDAFEAIGHAIDNHPNPAIRNITIDGHALRDQGATGEDRGAA